MAKFDIFSVIQLICGLTFFLFGMRVMSGDLEKMAGGRLEHSLKKVTSNPLISIGLGAVITIAMQSSSATTVMLVGLVNSGIMSFGQTLHIIFGANIGTTLTSWILSLSGIQSDNIAILMLKPKNFSPIIAFIGVLMAMLSKSDRRKSIGNIFVGFSVLMYGMEFMTAAVSPLANMPQFSELLVKFNNPLVGVLVGTLFTALIQGSAASIGILQALSLTGSITYGMAIPLIMGINIGTCATSLISCIGTNTNAKRVATVHISIKIIGTIICLTLFELLNLIFKFQFVNEPVNSVKVAMVHTVFNILITIILMPFTKLLIRMTEWLVKDKKQPAPASTGPTPVTLDERLMVAPSGAIRECESYTKKMCTLSCETIRDAIGLLGGYNKQKSETILKNEEVLDAYEDELSTYLVKLASQSLSDQDSGKISKMLHAIGDFERLGDHAVNLNKVAKELSEKGIIFSEDARRELRLLVKAIDEILTLTADAYKSNNAETAFRVEPLEQVIDHLIASIKSNQITRLQHGDCTIEMGFVLSDMLMNFERISDHCSNVAVAIIETEHHSFDTHKYLNGVKYGDQRFDEAYEDFSQKYTVHRIAV